MENLRRSRNHILLMMALGCSGLFLPSETAWHRVELLHDKARP